MNKKWVWTIGLAATTAVSGGVVASQFSGPSTTQSSYVLPVLPSAQTESILSVGDAVGGYRMAGIPRAHGARGAFVSKWVIDKSSLTVQSGSDLMQQVFPRDAATQSSSSTPAPPIPHGSVPR